MTSNPQAIVVEAADDEPTDAERRRVTELALRARREQAEVVRATEALREALRAHRQTTEVDLPDALRDIGQSEFKLLDGTPVSLQFALGAKQLSDDNPDGMVWLEEHGGKSLVRATVTAEFDAEDYDAAKEIYELIRRHPAANRLKKIDLERCVPWNTLTKWVGELIQKKMPDLPLKMLGVHRHTWAQVGKTGPKRVELKGFVER